MFSSSSKLYSTVGLSNMIATIGLHNDMARRRGLHMTSLAAPGHREGLIASIAMGKGGSCIVAYLFQISMHTKTLEKHNTKISAFQLRDLKAPLVRKNSR